MLRNDMVFFVANNKALVTGGVGFIGSHLTERLISDGWSVVILDNFDSFYDRTTKERNVERIRESYSSERLQILEGDIRDTTLLKRIFTKHSFSTVFHLAALAGVRPSVIAPDQFIDVNVKGTSILLSTCMQNGVENFIFGSSSSIYGGNVKIPFEECDAVNTPISPYAASKRSGELLAHTFSHLYGLKIACLRFFTVYGPRQRPDLAIHNFTEKIRNSEPIVVYGDGSSQRDYTYVDDIIDGIVNTARWIDTREKGTYEIFNLGNSNPITLKTLIEILEYSLGTRAKIKKSPLQPGDMNITFANIEKAKNLLSYSPKTSIHQGIQSFVDWHLRTFPS